MATSPTRPVFLVLVVLVLLGAVGYRSFASTSSAADAGPAGDGELPEGTSVYDHEHAGVTELDPHLLRALRRAARAAVDDDVDLVVNSGWRSRSYQQRLLDEAVATYGSRAEAARWVSTPDSSPHVSGDAVDIGPAPAAAWLGTYGAQYGLCRIYDNEPWHFELRPEATRGNADRCPSMYASPTHDPRMHQ